jgi:hypothetical protein
VPRRVAIFGEGAYVGEGHPSERKKKLRRGSKTRVVDQFENQHVITLLAGLPFISG